MTEMFTTGKDPHGLTHRAIMFCRTHYGYWGRINENGFHYQSLGWGKNTATLRAPRSCPNCGIPLSVMEFTKMAWERFVKATSEGRAASHIESIERLSEADSSAPRNTHTPSSQAEPDTTDSHR